MRHQQRGAYLVIMAILIIVLIGIAALAIDVGRLLVMRTEMQNAVDAAALAAAEELDGKSDAQSRARSAARDLLQHDARFAKVTSLLGSDGLPASAFEFFCVIGSETDVDPALPGFTNYCSGSEVETNKYAATSDTDSHYVRVTLDPGLVKDGKHFTSDLLFLPVLSALGLSVPSTASTRTSALAGRNFFTCNYPPMAICDPWEGTGSTFRDSMPVGGSIELRQQGSNQWANGDFGFLIPRDGGTGANAVAEYIANPSLNGCNPAVVDSQPGSISQKTQSAFNVRFDVYDPPSPFNKPTAYQDYPPAPNIVDYYTAYPDPPLAIDSRFGNGQWDFEQYWTDKHGTGFPNGWSNAAPPSRWEVYNYEINNSEVPESPDPSHITSGVVASRREMTVAVLSCQALDFKGKSSAVLFPPDGFAKIFILDKATDPGGGGTGLKIHGEFVGWATESDSDYHVEVQLYE